MSHSVYTVHAHFVAEWTNENGEQQMYASRETRCTVAVPDPGFAVEAIEAAEKHCQIQIGVGTYEYSGVPTTARVTAFRVTYVAHASVVVDYVARERA